MRETDNGTAQANWFYRSGISEEWLQERCFSDAAEACFKDEEDIDAATQEVWAFIEALGYTDQEVAWASMEPREKFKVWDWATAGNNRKFREAVAMVQRLVDTEFCGRAEEMCVSFKCPVSLHGLVEFRVCIDGVLRANYQEHGCLMLQLLGLELSSWDTTEEVVGAYINKILTVFSR